MRFDEMGMVGGFLILSLVMAFTIIRMFENAKTEIIISKIINGHEGLSYHKRLLSTLSSRFSFNKEGIRKNLISAGIYNPLFVNTYYLFKIIPSVILLLAIGAGWAIGQVSLMMALLYLMLIVFIFIIGPDTYLSMRAKSRTKHISSRLPFLLDLMSVCVGTGMTIEASLDYLGTELNVVDRDLAFVVRCTVERASIVGIEQALDEFHELVPTNEVQSFAMTLNQSLNFGSSIGPVLSSLARDIREISMLELEEKIGKMSTKMSIPMIVFIMVPVVILIVAPGIMRLLG
ncbi:pilus assembly protein TadC [Vibrio diazotrophicus]|uniref:Pilus assembly protein TadC n=1 Tax=Vibrio diazotrophicus TaxID=685 RepID=A0A2J8I4V4_VIBDI|nr:MULTISPECIES: type II secretion system F family protein [Vibrio]MCF7361906.1 type II secretion system F family protein [Vibrio sp. A1-b2]PNI05550.1 pilus assembly protein TadC [Vibrio diazotrophicus]